MAKSAPNQKIEYSAKSFFLRHKFIWVLALVVAAAAGIFSLLNTSRFTASLALTLSRAGTQEAIDYKYDSYYALKATDEFGDTVVGWFKTPEITSAINKKIGVDSSNWSLSDLSGRFKASKISPSLVEVRFGVSSEEETRKISQVISEIMNEKTNLLNNSSAQGIAFVVLAGEPVAVKNTYKFLLNILAGFLIGLAFGFFIQTARDYFN